MMNDVMGDFVKELTKRAEKAQAERIALAFIENGVTNLEVIARATGLSLEEVEELAKKKSA